jgi:hypothetical protein
LELFHYYLIIQSDYPLEAQRTDHQTSSMVNVLSTGQLQDHALLYALHQETNYAVYVLKIKCHPAYKLQLSQSGNQNLSRNVLDIGIYTHNTVNRFVSEICNSTS